MQGFEHFKATSPDLLFKSTKTGDPRLGEFVTSDGDIFIAGYPDDEGISLNNGRLGAEQAPDAVRSRLYKTSRSEFQKELRFSDIGNLDTGLSLEERHQKLKESVHHALNNKKRWVGIGGGHDYGYPDGAGFLLANKGSKQKPLVINFDAHLDVRPLDKGLSSGTPFYRLLTDSALPDFEFWEVGIQHQCNSQSHIKWAKQQGANILFYEDMMMSGEAKSSFILRSLAESMVRRRPTFISVDIDCFSTAYAMGCSQAWPTGFSPDEFFPVFNVLLNRLDVQCLGIYEVSPPLDLDERTVKLAAQIIYQFLGPLG